MSEQERGVRSLFLPIATVEHHLLWRPALSTYDMAEGLVNVWHEVEKDAASGAVTLDADSIMALNRKIAAAFDSEPGEFNRADDWPEFIEACGSIQESPSQALSLIFTSLYWNHLTRFRFATAWLYMNALRVQNGLPAQFLTFASLGPCLESLSGSGPPLYDGQTFYPDDFASPLCK